jgi:3-oxoacyl-[acyl-carrier protein] reductase
VDVWVNNAGADILTGAAMQLSPLEKLDQLLAVDLRGTILASWEAARLMREQPAGGVILNMSWDHVITGMEGRNPQIFSAVKGGILSFSKSLARSVAPKVRVNILAPGWIETEFAATTMDPEFYRRVAASTPLGRWGTPEDVARAAVFLSSSDAAFMTGQMLMIGGGIVM